MSFTSFQNKIKKASKNKKCFLQKVSEINVTQSDITAHDENVNMSIIYTNFVEFLP